MIPALMPTYARADIAFERGEGAYLYDGRGRAYLDFASGIAVTGLGHGHPHLLEALAGQARKLWHTSNLFEIPGQQRLAERLVAHSFADTVFFCNSGAEAVECGLKLIRKHFDATGKPERYRVITFEGAFHGRTLAAVSAGGQAKHLDGFGPPVDGFDKVPFGDTNAVRAAVRPETAAILVEPVQGESGVRPAPEGFLRALRDAADEFGLLLFFDEVQCGMGRTGTLFAYEHAGVAPDVMAIAKGIGGGFPLAACLATEAAASGMTPGSHGSTYGGGPLATAVGNAVLDVILSDGFLDRVRETGRLLRKRLEAVVRTYPRVLEEVRGLGLMLGLKCRCPHRQMAERLRAHGLLTAPADDNVVRFLPPMIIEERHIDEAVSCLGRACEDFGAGHA
ncbi:MAG: aspartate aminotransferase family protein [Alphaproteobacteria bacterium]